MPDRIERAEIRGIEAVTKGVRDSRNYETIMKWERCGAHAMDHRNGCVLRTYIDDRRGCGNVRFVR